MFWLAVQLLMKGFDMPEADGAMILSASSSKRQRIQRMG